MEIEYGSNGDICWLSEDGVSLIDTEGNKIESVQCAKCAKEVNPAGCVRLMGLGGLAYICKYCMGWE